MMIRRLGILIALLLTISVISANVARADATVTVTTANNLNLRSVPDVTGDVLAVVPVGTILKATARDTSSSWVLVNYQNTNGWLFTAWLTSNAPYAILPVTNRTAPPPSSDSGVIATALFDMNVRGGPGTQYEILDTLFAGDSVVLDGKSFGWYRYNYSGFTKGWLIAGFVNVRGNVKNLPDVTYPPYGAQP